MWYLTEVLLKLGVSQGAASQRASWAALLVVKQLYLMDTEHTRPQCPAVPASRHQERAVLGVFPMTLHLPLHLSVKQRGSTDMKYCAQTHEVVTCETGAFCPCCPHPQPHQRMSPPSPKRYLSCHRRALSTEKGKALGSDFCWEQRPTGHFSNADGIWVTETQMI